MFGGSYILEKLVFDNKRLGCAIRTTRQSAGMNQTDLAKASGMDQSNVSKMESEQHTPTLEILARIAIGLRPDSPMEVISVLITAAFRRENIG